MMRGSDQHIEKPLPRVPALPAHNRGERIRTGDGMALEYQLSVSDMPPDAGVVEQARRNGSAAQGKQRRQENQIGRRREQKSPPLLAGMIGGSLGWRYGQGVSRFLQRW